MVFFPNVELELWSYNESSVEYNIYGEKETYYTLQDTVVADFQVLSTNESIKEYGEILQDTYKAYIDNTVDIHESMIIRVKGYEDTYTITGTIILNNHFLPTTHKKILLKKMRKPQELTDEFGYTD